MSRTAPLANAFGRHTSANAEPSSRPLILVIVLRYSALGLLIARSPTVQNASGVACADSTEPVRSSSAETTVTTTAASTSQRLASAIRWPFQRSKAAMTSGHTR